jgi:hypothetical protein
LQDGLGCIVDIGDELHASGVLALLLGKLPIPAASGNGKHIANPRCTDGRRDAADNLQELPRWESFEVDYEALLPEAAGPDQEGIHCQGGGQADQEQAEPNRHGDPWTRIYLGGQENLNHNLNKSLINPKSLQKNCLMGLKLIESRIDDNNGCQGRKYK